MSIGFYECEMCGEEDFLKKTYLKDTTVGNWALLCDECAKKYGKNANGDLDES